MVSVFVVLILCAPLPAAARQADPARQAVHVLCYHAFLDNKSPYSFTLEETEAHIRFFLDKGFRFVSVHDVLRGNYRGVNNILVTIDDGNKSVYNAYFSVFKNHGIKPLLAVYPAIIGKKEYALSWAELDALAREGCVIASHGYHHLYVNQKLYDSNRAAFMKEIVLSRSILEKELKRAVDIFVYPFGVHSPITIEKLRESGYRYAFAIQGGHLGPEHVLEGAMKLPRYLMTRKNAQGLLAHISRDARRLAGQPTGSLADKQPAPVKKSKAAQPGEHAYLPALYPVIGVDAAEPVKSTAVVDHAGAAGPVQRASDSPAAVSPFTSRPSSSMQGDVEAAASARLSAADVPARFRNSTRDALVAVFGLYRSMTMLVDEKLQLARRRLLSFLSDDRNK
jgi:peptidoglycan/xylan/chitin deacetylase (PgdA/CDA1 family)